MYVGNNTMGSGYIMSKHEKEIIFKYHVVLIMT